jgi:hypothetical protein
MCGNARKISTDFTKAQNLNIGLSIWHVAPSDNVQRQMLAAVVDVKFKHDQRMRSYLLWAKNAADRLATIRNDAAHVSTAFRTDREPFGVVASAMGNSPNREQRLSKLPNLQRHFRTAKADLVQLSGFLYALLLRMLDRQTHPWPRRRAMRSVRNPA